MNYSLCYFGVDCVTKQIYMEDFVRLFEDEKMPLFISGFISIYAALLALMITRMKSSTYRKRAEKEKAYELLLKGHEQQTLNDKAISLIYKREIARKYESISYIDFLESFLIYVRQKDDDGALTTNISLIINPILEKEKAEKPYSNVSQPTLRNLLSVDFQIKKH